jgi:hypothetical protein
MVPGEKSHWHAGKDPRLESQVQVLQPEERISVFVLDEDTRTKVSESTEDLITTGPYLEITRIYDMDEIIIRMLYCLVVGDALVGL